MQEITSPNPRQRTLAAVGITSLLCWFFAFTAINFFGDYAWSLFVWLPFVLGASATLIYGFKHTTERAKLFTVSMLTLLIFCLGLLAFAWEGLICLIMALPIGLFFTWLGSWVGYMIIKSKGSNPNLTTFILFLSVPLLMAFENAQQEKEDMRSVTTSIVINASAEEVWQNVIAFPQLKDPTEFIFKTGIAYPINATIKGEGVGAVRHCNFSTGSFVEPITIWDKPNLLQFSVTEQPEPMKEVSFYDIHPNHLHGYWVSKQGQFKLTPLANGSTLLEGTTWYTNKIKPAVYWTVWSDYVVHKIHQRVLKHIKMEAEK